MPDALASLSALLSRAAVQYERLVLVVGNAPESITALLNAAATRAGAPVIDMSTELARRLLSTATTVRAAKAPAQIAALIAEHEPRDQLYLDRTDLLFAPTLALEPLRALKRLSVHRTIVAAWHGRVCDGWIVRAAPGRPDHIRVPTADLLHLDLAAHPSMPAQQPSR